MTEQVTTRAPDALFAAKGDAAPSPSLGNVTVHQRQDRPGPARLETSWVDPGPRFRIPGLEDVGVVNPAPAPKLAALIRLRDDVTPTATVIDPQQVLSIPHGGGRCKPARARRVIPQARALPPWVNPNSP